VPWAHRCRASFETLRKNGQVVCLLAHYDDVVNTVEKTDRLREFVELISGSLDEQVDGFEIASRGCLSRYHFDRLVSAAMGEAPGAFRRRLLLERAAWEIGRTDDSITWIALNSGFQSPEGFSRAFKRAYEMSPAEYRRRHRRESGPTRNNGSGEENGATRAKPTGQTRSSNPPFRIAAPSGVHFHPPGGILIPGKNHWSTRMDIVDRLTGHDLWFTSRLIETAATLPDEALDKPVLKDMPLLFGSHPITTREILASMVANKERWTATVKGVAVDPPERDTVGNMRDRLKIFGGEFEKLAKDIDRRGAWDEGFVDVGCDPPISTTYGGMLAHVINFSTYRRNLAILALRELGVPEDNLGLGDPAEYEREVNGAA